jgi:hypothetical protein
MATMDWKEELTARIEAETSAGEPATLIERTRFFRVRELNGSWSPWQQGERRYTWGHIPVNPREGGDWETAEYEPRRLTRRP